VRLKFLVAYDGPSFSGWQSQPGKGTVQDALEEAARAVCGTRVCFHGAGRTDAGVHAFGQVCHADFPSSERMDAGAWRRALNAHLPPTLRVLDAVEAAPDFHARFSATGKIYRYRIFNGEVLPPWEFGRAWHLPGKFHDDSARAAAAVMTGPHDFAAFSANRGSPVNDTRRTLARVEVSRDAHVISLEFEGGGFLYKMARMLTAAIAHCARGRCGPEEIAARLESGIPKWTHVAPPHGLALVRVLYGRPPTGGQGVGEGVGDGLGEGEGVGWG